MKRFYVVITVGVILVAVLVWGFYFYSCVKFVPLRLERGFRNELVPAPELMNTEYFEGLQIVLHYYGEEFHKFKSMNLFITWRLSLKKELCWNYIKKATNKSFVKSIKGKRLDD